MKKYLFILALLGMFFLGSCSTYIADAEQTNPLKIWPQNDNGIYHTLVVVDDDTGVNYVVVSTELGNGNTSIAITDRLTRDGNLYTSPGGN